MRTFNPKSSLLLLVLLSATAQLLGGCVVRTAYTEPYEEPVVASVEYQPRYYDGRRVYYRDGGWGYWVSGSWYAYPVSHPIYVTHRYPRRAAVVAHSRHYSRPVTYRPAHRSDAHRGRPVVVHGRDRHQGHGVHSGGHRATPRKVVTQPQRRGDRARNAQRQDERSGRPQRGGNTQGGGESRGEHRR